MLAANLLVGHAQWAQKDPLDQHVTFCLIFGQYLKT